MLNLFDAYFNSAGLNYTLANSGANCLDEVRRGTKEFDVIILDTGMYDINGLQVAKTIRELNPDQKIIITTANRQRESEKRSNFHWNRYRKYSSETF